MGGMYTPFGVCALFAARTSGFYRWSPSLFSCRACKQNTKCHKIVREKEFHLAFVIFFDFCPARMQLFGSRGPLACISPPPCG
nr:MAG TPA: hypothetical protein [Caudoviricetes sp.]